ncbi:MAG: response regulator [Thermodesulfobacteriota bacterium]
MEILKDFRSKDTVEQVVVLDEIGAGGSADALPELFALFAEPLGDEVVDAMVYHTLTSVLAGKEEAILAGLAHPAAAVRRLCVEEAGKAGLAAAVPILLRLLPGLSEPAEVAAVLQALLRLPPGDPAAMLAAFQPFLQHPDATVATLAVQGAVAQGGAAGRDAVLAFIAAAPDFVQSGGEDCDLVLAMAITALGGCRDEQTAGFLVRHIHHGSPIIRRLIGDALVGLGSLALPALGEVLRAGRRDERIMAANVVGFMGDRKGAELLTAVMDARLGMEENLKFAVYEALGRIPSMRSIVCLADGLAETDELTLAAVLTGLDNLVNAGVVKRVQEVLVRQDEVARRVVTALIMARAVRLFRALYQEGSCASLLVAGIAASPDGEARAQFAQVLGELAGPQAAADAKRLAGAGQAASGRQLLAADDSKAMLHFYRAAAAEMGLAITTAADGRQALEHLRSGAAVDLLITDMNMPEMDGIELTRQARQLRPDLPIIMATTESEASQQAIARQAGVTAFVTKPFSKDVLKAKLQELLGAS